MHAKYEFSTSYGSKVIANVLKLTTNRQDKNNMPPIIWSGGIKIDLTYKREWGKAHRHKHIATALDASTTFNTHIGRRVYSYMVIGK